MTNLALESIQGEYEALHAACAIADARGDGPPDALIPKESINMLEGTTKILENGQYLGDAYTAYLHQCKDSNTAPDSPEIWISAAGAQELAKVRDVLVDKSRDQVDARGAAAKRRKLPVP